MNLTEKQFTERIATRSGLTPTQAKAVLEAVGAEFASLAASGGAQAKVPGIGRFSATAKPERLGRNPQSGDEITIAAHTSCVLRLPPSLRKVAV